MNECQISWSNQTGKAAWTKTVIVNRQKTGSDGLFSNSNIDGTWTFCGLFKKIPNI